MRETQLAHTSPDSKYRRILSPWKVCRLDIQGKWIIVSSFRRRSDAESYQRILAASATQPIEVVFESDRL